MEKVLFLLVSVRIIVILGVSWEISWCLWRSGGFTCILSLEVLSQFFASLVFCFLPLSCPQVIAYLSRVSFALGEESPICGISYWVTVELTKTNSLDQTFIPALLWSNFARAHLCRQIKTNFHSWWESSVSASIPSKSGHIQCGNSHLRKETMHSAPGLCAFVSKGCNKWNATHILRQARDQWCTT